ncbi:MAG: TIGR02281 family clan AA aspartic protease [Erythrobacter sp.]
MREAVLLVVAVCAFVGAAFVPGGAFDSVTGDDPSQVEAERVAAEQKRNQAFAAWSAGETVLPRGQNGHFFADASVNGVPVGFMVDTGASVIALTGADAAAAGLMWNEADVRVVASGASGPVRGVYVRLDSVELGGHRADNVDAIIVPEGLGISLLGQSFLRTIEPVRIEGDQMILGGG